MMVSKTLTARRGGMYRLLARLCRTEADEALLNGLKTVRFPAETAGSALLKDYLAKADDKTVTALAVDFAGLFLAAGSADGKGAIPCESLYTGKNGRFMEEAWEDVTRRYREAGMGKSAAYHDLMEDHLALELEFMAHLTETAGPAEQLDFLRSHLTNWVPRLAEDMEKLAKTDFYKAVGKMTVEFLEGEEALLEGGCVVAPSYSVRTERFDNILARLRERYKVFAPKRFPGRGPKGTDLIRYGEIDHLTDIVYREKSNLSPKEVFYPVSQTMFRFTETDCTQEELSDEKGLIIFLRPCDLNAVERLDNIFLHNGEADLYYSRMRERCKFILMECAESFENCFCCSLGTNTAENYHAAVRIDDICAIFEVRDEELLPYFADEVPADFTPRFVTENKRAMEVPEIGDREELKAVISHPYWEQFDEKCISCGGCNTGCPTCSCFDTVDVIYHETSREGERRRVWSSCMLADFTKTAGGGMARKTPGANMRFKVLHKVYDYKLRFGTTMCVGCGRCMDRCPKEIDYLDVVNGLTAALKEGKQNG